MWIIRKCEHFTVPFMMAVDDIYGVWTLVYAEVTKEVGSSCINPECQRLLPGTSKSTPFTKVSLSVLFLKFLKRTHVFRKETGPKSQRTEAQVSRR